MGHRKTIWILGIIDLLLLASLLMLIVSNRLYIKRLERDYFDEVAAINRHLETTSAKLGITIDGLNAILEGE